MAHLGRKKGSGRPKPAMNVTPLVDIVLVLLIIFMVAIPALEDGISLNLPPMVYIGDESEDAEEGEEAEPFVLALTAEGALYLDQESVEMEEVSDVLMAASSREPDRKLMLRADGELNYGRVRELFSQAQEIGFPGISLRVNQPQEEAAVAESEPLARN